MPTNTHMKVIIIDLTVINKQATEFVIIKIICCFLLIGSLTLKKRVCRMLCALSQISLFLFINRTAIKCAFELGSSLKCKIA